MRSTRLISHDPIGTPGMVTCAVALNTSSASAGATPAIAHGATLAASDANSFVVLERISLLERFLSYISAVAAAPCRDQLARRCLLSSRFGEVLK